MTDDDIPPYTERRTAIYARGAGTWLEALYVLAAPLTPRWKWNEIARRRGAPAKVGCRICARRPPRPTDASVDDCDLDQPKQLFVTPQGAETGGPFYTYCREHYRSYWSTHTP